MTIYEDHFEKIHEDTEEKRQEALAKQARQKEKEEDDKYAKIKQAFGD